MPDRQRLHRVGAEISAERLIGFGVAAAARGPPELGNVFGDRVVERQLALIDQHHGRDRRDRLGHRGDAIDRALADRHAGLGVLQAGQSPDARSSPAERQAPLRPRSCRCSTALFSRSSIALSFADRTPAAASVAARQRLRKAVAAHPAYSSSKTQQANDCGEARQRHDLRVYFSSLRRMSLNCTVIAKPGWACRAITPDVAALSF